MVDTRKVRKVGGSLVITLPHHIAKFYNIKEGDILELSPTHIDNIILKKKV